MFYKKLGSLPNHIIEDLKSMILSQDINFNEGFTRIEFNKPITDYLSDLFENSNLKVQISADGSRLIQKAFYSDPNFVYPIHRDGIRCRSALNIVLDCSDDDWTRWYDFDLIKSLSDTSTIKTAEGKSTEILIYLYPKYMI